MRETELSFMEGFISNRGKEAKVKGNKQMYFDWDKAATIIKNHFEKHKDLTAEAGLQGDWDYTGGGIFREGKPTNENYTFLKSNWAIPTLLLSWDDKDQEEIECYTVEETRFESDSKWDETSLNLLGISL